MRIELATGRESRRETEVEMWIDEERQRMRSSVRRDGRVLKDSLVALSPPDVGLLGPFVTPQFFAPALAQGRARVTGEDTLRGRRVYWIELLPPPDARVAVTWQAAIEVDTERTVLLRAVVDGRVGYEMELVRIEQVARNEEDFRAPPQSRFQTVTVGERITAVSRATAVRAFRGALWPGPRVAGVRLSSLELRTVRRDEPGTAGSGTGRVLQVNYGRRSTPRYIEIRQAAAPDALRIWEDDLLPPPPGFIDLSESRMGGDTPFGRTGAGESIAVWTGSLEKSGLYVTIQATRRETVLAVARALRRMPRPR